MRAIMVPPWAEHNPCRDAASTAFEQSNNLAYDDHIQLSKPDQTPLKLSETPDDLKSQIFPDGSALIVSTRGAKLDPPALYCGRAYSLTSSPESEKNSSDK